MKFKLTQSASDTNLQKIKKIQHRILQYDRHDYNQDNHTISIVHMICSLQHDKRSKILVIFSDMSPIKLLIRVLSHVIQQFGVFEKGLESHRQTSTHQLGHDLDEMSFVFSPSNVLETWLGLSRLCSIVDGHALHYCHASFAFSLEEEQGLFDHPMMPHRGVDNLRVI